MFVRFLFVFDLLVNLFSGHMLEKSFVAICWERAIPFAFHLCCFYFSAVLILGVPFPFGVYGRIWNSVVSVPEHCLLIYILYLMFLPLTSHKQTKSRTYLSHGLFILVLTDRHGLAKLKFLGHLTAPFLVGSMSVCLNVLICHLFIHWLG